MIALSGVLRAIGFAVWTVWPTYTGFAIGFLLWGIRSALSSGAREALVYDELAAVGAGDRFVRTLGRSGTVALLSMFGAMVLAAPAYAWGGYRLIGAASVAVSLASALVACSFPETPRAHRVAASGVKRYLAHLRDGLGEARRSPRLRHALLIAAAVPGLGAVDEYIPLLAREMGATTVAVSLLLLLPTGGMAVASWHADRWRHVARPVFAAGLVAAGLLLGTGALVHVVVGAPPVVGMLAVAACFALLQSGTVISAARLQTAMSGASRATVLSVAGVGMEVFALGVYASYAAGATVWRGPSLSRRSACRSSPSACWHGAGCRSTRSWLVAFARL
jgi:hypothetical protein